MIKKSILTIISILLTTIAYAQPEWYAQNSGTNSFLFDACFVDQNTGWVCGHLGTILYTSDGGNNWNDLNPPPINYYNAINFIDQNEGWVVGYAGSIRHTTDGGTNWNEQNSPTERSISDLYFIAKDKGWTVGGKPRTFTDPIREILHTTNGGVDWTIQYSGSNEEPLGSVFFLDENYGWTVGAMSTIMKTTNGGATWNTQMSGPGYEFEDVHFINPDTGWVVGQDLSLQHYAVIFSTVDGGTNWDVQTFGMDDSFQGIQFVNETKGWVVGGNNNEAIILYTSDGGVNWSPQDPATTNFLSQLYFIDENIGWAVGFDGTIIHTDNAVSVELDQSSPPDYSLDQNYPNPFNPATTIQYSVPNRRSVVLKVYDMLGNGVVTLVNEEKGRGVYSVNLDGSSLASGMYLYRLQAGDFVETKKMVLMK